MSYGSERPGTARFAPIEWLLQVRDLAHGWPVGVMTPHCRSTSTGPLGLGTLGLGSSFFFFFGPAFSSSPSAFLFLPPTFAAAGSVFLPATFLPALTPAGGFLSPSSSLSLSSSAAAAAVAAGPPSASSALRASSSRAASLARSRASRASFFRWAFSFLIFKHAAMCCLAAVLSTLFLQCLHCWRSGESSSGRPVANVSRAVSSRGFTTGDGDGGFAADGLAFLSAAFPGVSISFASAGARGEAGKMGIRSMMAPSFQFPGSLCFGAGFLSLMTPFALASLASFFEATLMVASSSAPGVVIPFVPAVALRGTAAVIPLRPSAMTVTRRTAPSARWTG